MGIARRIGEHLLVPVARRVPFLQHLAAFIDDQLGPDGYGRLRDRFIQNGRESHCDMAARRDIVRRFEHVHTGVTIHSSRSDGLILAEALLSCATNGALAECGCFAGGSTAKLSILARMLGRPLFVFDSFEGLPTPDAGEAVDFHARREQPFEWRAGDCSARLDEVRRTVERFGEIGACTFVPGWFEETLASEMLPPHLAFAYTDVVLASSARQCLRALWPRLEDGGLYFSRDIAFTKVLQSLLDEAFWRDEMRAFPPILLGAGFGMRDQSPHLGLMVKGSSVSAEYLDGLMVNKALRVHSQ